MALEELQKKIELLRCSLTKIQNILDVHGYDYAKFLDEYNQLAKVLSLGEFDQFQLKSYVLEPFFDECVNEIDVTLFAAFTKVGSLISLLDNYCLENNCTLSNPNEEVQLMSVLALDSCDFNRVLKHYKL